MRPFLATKARTGARQDRGVLAGSWQSEPDDRPVCGGDQEAPQRSPGQSIFEKEQIQDGHMAGAFKDAGNSLTTLVTDGQLVQLTRLPI